MGQSANPAAIVDVLTMPEEEESATSMGQSANHAAMKDAPMVL